MPNQNLEGGFPAKQPTLVQSGPLINPRFRPEPTSTITSTLPPFRAGVTPLPGGETEFTSADPVEIFNQQYGQQVSKLRDVLAQTENLATSNAQNRLRTLENEYKIEVNTLRNKFESIPTWQRDEGTFQNAWGEWDRLNTKYNLAVERIRGKARPDVETIRSEGNEALWNLETKKLRGDIELGVLKNLQGQGLLTDEQYLQQALQVSGIDVPISFLRAERQPDTITGLGQMISVTEAELKKFQFKKRWGADELLYSPTGFDTELRSATAEEKMQYNSLVHELPALQRQRALLLAEKYEAAGDLRMAGSLRRAFRLASLPARLKDPYRGMGGFAQGVAEAKDKATPAEKVVPISKVQPTQKVLTEQVARRYLQRFGGDANKAMAAAQRDGYQW